MILWRYAKARIIGRSLLDFSGFGRRGFGGYGFGVNINNNLIINGFSLPFKVQKRGCIIRYFATNAAVQKENENFKLDPWGVSGFADGESCFHVSIIKNNKLKTGFQVKLSFTITLYIKDSAVLALIKKY